MSTHRMSSISTEYVPVGPVRRVVAGVVTDPTALVAEFAILTAGVEPAEPDWVPGSWEAGQGRYFARVLVGPDDGDIDPGNGTWTVWMRVTDDPERPAKPVGVLVIT